MWLRRIVWIIILFFSIIFYVFNNSPATLAVPICLAILPVASFLIMKFLYKVPEIRFLKPASVSKNKEIPLEFLIRNSGFFPINNATVIIEQKNVRTGGTSEMTLESGALGKKEVKLTGQIKPEHYGKMKLSVKDVIFRDIFGMFQSRRSVDVNDGFSVNPERFAVSVSLTNCAAALLETDKFSSGKKDSNSSEIMGIKEYVPGDPVKNMHWKLSAKTDKLLIKELGTPVVDQVCLFLDMTHPEDADENASDTVAEVFASIADAMLGNEMSPEVGWQDPECGVLQLRNVRSEEELGAVIEEMMSVPLKENGFSISDAIAMSSDKLGFAHVVAVGVSPELDVAHISNGAMATLILPDTETESYGLQSDGTDVIVFGSESYRDDLSQIDI